MISTSTFEWLALMIQYWIKLIYSLSLFMMIIFRNSIQDGMKFYFRCQQFHPMISWTVCIKLRTRESAQLKTVLELSSDWSSWRSVRLCWFTLCCSSWWQHSGIRYEMGSTFIVNGTIPTWWHPRKSVQLEDTWVWSIPNRIGIVWHGDSSEDNGSQLSEVERHGVKMKRSETSITKLGRQAREKLNLDQW